MSVYKCPGSHCEVKTFNVLILRGLFAIGAVNTTATTE